MYCFDVIRTLISADHLRLTDVKQNQNIIANKTADRIVTASKNFLTDVSGAMSATANQNYIFA